MALHIFWTFLRLGCTSFGGPVAHLGYFRTAFVESKKWFSEQEYAHLLSVCQTLPGPASSQVGFAIGLLKGGWLGAIAAFIGFTLPSIVLLIVFAESLSIFNNQIGLVALQGLAILAFIVVLQAVLGMGKQILSDHFKWLLALVMFVVTLSAQALYWQIIGIFSCALMSAFFSGVMLGQSSRTGTSSEINSRSMESFSGNKLDANNTGAALFADRNFVKISMFSASICAILFCALLVLLPMFSNEFYPPAAAFYQSGAMVFGGGHVVLPFLEQATVASDLLSQEQFLAGYGATQAVPGPMFSFAAYLGYVSELNQQVLSLGTQDNTSLLFYPYALFAGLLATGFLFLPGFLLLGTFLPISQKLLVYPKIKKAFAGANAAVVGLLAATLYDPIFTHAINSKIDLIIAAIGFVALVRFRLPILLIVLMCIGLSVGTGLYTA